MNKALRNTPLWLSVPLGLVIAVVCFTGAMLVFEQEIVSVTHRKLLFVDDAPGRPLPLGTLMGRAVQSLPPGAKATGVSVSSDPRRAYRVNLSEPRGAAIVIDQYTGRVRGVYERPAFFRVMFSLHRWLLDSPRRGEASWGKVVVGVSVIMFVLALLSGVAVWWPRRGQGLRRALTVRALRGRSDGTTPHSTSSSALRTPAGAATALPKRSKKAAGATPHGRPRSTGQRPPAPTSGK